MSHSVMLRAVNRLGAARDSIPWTLKNTPRSGSNNDEQKAEKRGFSTRQADRQAISCLRNVARAGARSIDPEFFQTKPRTLDKAARRAKLKIHAYGKIEELRSVLGLNSSVLNSAGSMHDTKRGSFSTWPFKVAVQPPPSTGITLLAIDTESEEGLGARRIVEVGITTLNTSDITNVSPGSDVSAWMAHTKHYHVVIDVTRKPKARMRSSLFADSQFLSPAEARAALSEIWADLGVRATDSPGGAESDPVSGEVIIVGQAVQLDLTAIFKGLGLHFGVGDGRITSPQAPASPSFSASPHQRRDNHPIPKHPGPRVRGVYDTHRLACEATRRGARFPSLKLAQLVKALGANAKYFAAGSLRGVHNASNDAAYTMMALLLFATRWHDLVGMGGDAHDEKQIASGDSDLAQLAEKLVLGNRIDAATVQKGIFARKSPSRPSDWARWFATSWRKWGW